MNQSREIPRSRINLKLTGDMYATAMGWLEDVDAGGGTAFTAVQKVDNLENVVWVKVGGGKWRGAHTTSG